MRDSRGLAMLLVTLLAAAAQPAHAVDKDKARYVGGAVQSIPADAEGTFSTAAGSRVTFIADAGGGSLEIPFGRILDVSYGQKTEKKLFGTRREHFVWIAFREAGNDAPPESTVLFELGKDIVLATLDELERGTGRKIVYADAEAARFREGERGR